VTAIYEVTLVGSPGRMVDPLRYPQGGAAPSTAQAQTAANTGEYAFVKVRYKLPNESTSHLLSHPVTDANVVQDFARLPEDLRFAAAVAGAGQLLRHDPYVRDFTYDRAIEIAQASRGADQYGYRTEFVQMLRSAKTAAAMSPLEQPGQGGTPP
jgi:Ca-activated chloride channel family protein